MMKKLVTLTLFLSSAGTAVVACSSSGSSSPEQPDTGVADSAPSVDAGDASSDAGTDEDSSILPQGPIDRVGRPSIKLLLIPSADRVAYNQATPFEQDGGGALLGTVEASLHAVDRWDGTSNWPAAVADGGVSHPLSVILSNDALLVDTSKPFSSSSYLDIEKEMVGLGAHTTCGGRWLADDDTDSFLSLAVKKAMTGVSDGVAAATKAPLDTFPYLPAPN